MASGITFPPVAFGVRIDPLVAVNRTKIQDFWKFLQAPVFRVRMS